ncbi:Alpha/beta hydrolase fold-1 [Apiospora arundinis]
MVFTSPSYVPELSIDPPDSISIDEFILTEKYNHASSSTTKPAFTCGLTGESRSIQQIRQRVTHLSRAISKRLGFAPNEGTEWDKVVALFSYNTVDYLPLTWAVHRLAGVVTPASAVYSAQELEHQLRSSGARALFTCVPLLDVALVAAKAAGIPRDRIFLLPMSGHRQKGDSFLTVNDLIREGAAMPEVEPLRWVKGQGARQVAYLCYSSGTSGQPKAVMISHRNVIANTMQYTTYESVARKRNGIKNQTVLGLLPFSHIYGLVVVTHSNIFRGDEIVVLPRFEMKSFLGAVQKFRIEHLYLVPPILISIIGSRELCSQYDLSSVRYVYTGAAPLGTETVDELLKQYPKWRMGQGYGLTETCTVICSTNEHDIDQGSSGSLVPMTKAKIIDTEGVEITEHGRAGELLVQTPSLTLGYLNNAKATAETYIFDEDGGRWMRTGDEVMIRLSAAGNEHLVVVDRIKELIKVNGHQVAPAELEAHLLSHPYVADCAVIQVPDEKAGEAPKAYIVKSDESKGLSDKEVATAVSKYVEEHKARHKWLKGGVEFFDAVPKSPTGKILRRLLRDKEKAERKSQQAKL